MIFNILSSVFIWGAALIVLLRLISNSGIRLGLPGAIFADKGLHGGFETGRRDTAAVFGLSLLFRLIVFLLSILAIYIFRENKFSWDDLINTYLKWDANNYQRIAIGGYSYHVENGSDFTTLAFFPLYPWLIRIVNIIFRNEIVSGIIVSSLLYSGACCFLYKLMAIDYNRATTIRAIVFISVFPHSLFLGVMMNESTLLFTLCAGFYFIRRHNWPLVGIFGALAALSRLAGILLAIPAAVEWLEEYKILDRLRRKEIGEVWRLFYSKGLWIFLMLLGTGIYLYCNYKTTGDWFKFMDYQKRIWHHENCYFGKGIAGIFANFAGTDTYTRFAIWLPSIVSVIFAIAALIYGLRRHRTMYCAFLIIYIIINTSFTWSISVARYMVCALPAFMILSDFSERHKWSEQLLTASMAIAFGIYFVAYFMGRQIL